MRDIGIRIQRYKLSRYRPPGAVSERVRWLLTLGLAGWLIWALFLSDHSAVRLLALNARKADAEARLRTTQASVDKLEGELKSADDPEVGEKVLRDRHNYARPEERLYILPHVDGSTAPRVDERIPADATTPAVAPPPPAPAKASQATKTAARPDKASAAKAATAARGAKTHRR